MCPEESDYNPFQPPEVNFEVMPDQPRVSRWFNLALSVFLLTMIVGGIIGALEIRSITISGAILSCVGVWIAVLGKKAGLTLGLWLGVSGPVFSALCFALIYFNDWSPDDARQIVPSLILIYVCIAGFCLMMVFIDVLDKQPKLTD